jgi:lamin tail-like protein/CotH protein
MKFFRLIFVAADVRRRMSTSSRRWLHITVLFFAAMSVGAQVVVNEIMYNPGSHDAREEWVELLNTSSTNVNLSGWTISGGIDFAFPTNTTIGAGQYLVVAAHLPTFSSKFPSVVNVVGSWLIITVHDFNGRLLTNSAPVLSNSRNSVNLNNAAGDRVDSVTYADAGDWAIRRLAPPDGFGRRGWIWTTDADGLGSSLELRNPALPNQYGQNWVASPVNNPTPGRVNSSRTSNIPPMVTEVNHAPIIPRSSDPVTITARVIDESAAGLTVTLWSRVDSNSPPPFSSSQMFDDGAHGDASAGDGIYGIVLPAMANDTLIEFYVEARDAQGNTRSWPGPTMDSTTAHDANAMFQVDDTTYNGSPPTYKMIMTTAQFNLLQTIFNTSPNSDAQVNMTFISIDATGIEHRYLCGTRNRGHGSRGGTPHNYRANFPDDTPWKGATGFNINARVVPAQVVGAAIAQRAGAAGNRARFIQIRVNNGPGPGGTPANGLYAGNEDIDGDWAERQFPHNGDGNIYSVYRDIAPPNFNYRGEDPGPYRTTYFKESNTAEDDWQDLIGMLFVMGENQTSAFDINAARQVMNVEQWLLHLAVMNLFGNNETGLNTGYNDDYYLYSGDVDPRFVLAYHDLDTILGLGGSLAANNANIFTATSQPGGGGSGVAMNFFMHHPAVEPLYYRTLQNLLDTTFSQAQFDSIVDSVFGDFPAMAGNATTVKSYMNTRRTTVQGVISGLVPPPAEIALATISGEPRSPTWRTSATLTVAGAGLSHYQWRLNNGALSAQTAINTPINLSSLPNGSTNTIYVLGRLTSGVWQTVPTVSKTWIVNTATATVRLNEVLARNVSAVNIGGGQFPDMIELYNEGTALVNLGGLWLSDDPAAPFKFMFQPSASLAANTYLVLSENDLGFALEASGEGLFLFNSAGTAVLDSVSFGPQLPDLSIGRFGASGAWTLTQPTFGATNVVRSTGSAANVRINEWLAFGSASNPDDLMELYNIGPQPVDLAGHYLTDNPLGWPDRHRMPDLSFIGAGSFLVLVADGDTDNPDHVNFGLEAEQGEIALFSPQLAAIDCVTYGPQRRDVPMGRCPDGGNSIRTGVVPTFGFANLCPVPPPPPQMINIMPLTNTWRYLTNANLDDTNWQAPTFDDSGWRQGIPLIGNGSGGPSGEIIRTPITTPAGHITYYFRSTFTYPTNFTPNSLQFSNVIDDGAVFYINGREVARYRLPGTGAITWGTLAEAFSGSPPWSGPLPISVTNVQPGLNSIAVEVHQGTPQSGDLLFGTRLDAIIVTNDPAAAGLVINEILASNGSFTNLDGSTPDLVELYNPSTNALDLGGMIFTDDPLGNPGWTIPPGTILPGHSYIVFEFDGDKPASSINSGFGLGANGDKPLYLLTAQSEYIDSVEYGVQVEDYSIGRVPDGSTNWMLTLPTLGTPNAAAPLGNLRNLKINEWMAEPFSGPDWFEIYNPDTLPVRISGCFLSDVVAEPMRYLPIKDLSYLGAGTNAWKRFVADENLSQGANHAPFRMNNTAEEVIISDPNGGRIDSISYSYVVPLIGISEGRLPDGADQVVFFEETDSPGEANYLALSDIVVNEVLTHTDPPMEDAIELHNLSGAAVNIGGWWLSDSRRQLRKYQIPPNTSIAAGGYAVFYEERFNNRDVAADPFALSSSDGDEVYLSPISGSGALNGYRASADFGAAANGVSFGRFVNSVGTVDYPALTRRTFGRDNALTVQEFRLGTGAGNAYPIVGPIVITEIMYHPPDIGTQDNVGHEYIELYNVTSNSVALYDPASPTNTWRLRDAVDFNFPPNTTIAPGGYLIVVSFDPATNAPALNSFRIQYGTNFTLTGPYSGKLDNSADSVELYRPDTPNPGGKVPYILVDRIRYSDVAPWYPNADGLGQSLQRLSAVLYGNDPGNWTSAAPALGPSGAADDDSDGMPDSWELAHGLNPDNEDDAEEDPDEDGFKNLQEYRAGTDPQNPQSYLRIGPITAAPGAVVIEFPAAAGITYSIIYRSELQATSWTKLIDIPAQSTAQFIRVFDPSPDPKRFYRLATPSLP